jgi:hypothetical protein
MTCCTGQGRAVGEGERPFAVYDGVIYDRVNPLARYLMLHTSSSAQQAEYICCLMIYSSVCDEWDFSSGITPISTCPFPKGSGVLMYH